MRIARLMGRILSVSLQRELAHRVNLAFAALLTLISIGADVAALALVFSRVERLAGWRLEEALVLLGAYQMISGLMETFVEPNLAWFAEKVTRGHLDDLLLQPVSSLFMASLGTARPLSLPKVALGLCVLLVGASRLGPALTVGGALAFVALLVAGTVAAWATRVLMAELSFWAPGVEITVLYSAFWQLGRYPVAVFPRMVRALLTYVVPVAVVATVPTLALTRGPSPALLALGVLVAGGFALAAALGWRAGVRRYTGATS